MSTTIDLGKEVVLDMSTIRDPYVRLMMVSIGEALAQGSPWVAVSKSVARRACIPTAVIDPRRHAFTRSGLQPARRVQGRVQT